jgi:WD40 repeat protein
MTTSSNDQTVRIWNLEALNRPPLIIKYDYHPGSLCFSADDTQLLIAQAKGATSNFMIQAWPINFDKISSDLCTLIGRNFTKEEWETFVPSDYPYERVCKDISN